jgi:8-oxo-dGTP pyrophosphatase MutT (NUDIX family)
MMLTTLIEALRHELRKPLPGLKAQLRLSPEVRRNKITDINIDRPPKKGGVLILLYDDGDGVIRFPLMQRPQYNGPHSGQVSFPGGKMEDHDNNLVDTALREAQEEIGVRAADIEVLGTLTDLYVWASNFLVRPVLAYARQRPVFTPDLEEATEVLEVQLQSILTNDRIRKKKLTVRGNIRIEAPYYDIHNKVVWGATAMMLSELAEVVNNTGIYADC